MPVDASFNLLNCINEAVFVVNIQLEIVFVNQYFEKFVTRKSPLVLGHKCYDIMVPNATGPCSKGICPAQQIFSGHLPQADQCPRQIQTANGAVKPVCLSAAPVPNGQSPALVSILLRDFTEVQKLQQQATLNAQQLFSELQRRRKMESSLRRSESMYRAMFEYTSTTMLVIDQDHTIIKANRRFERMTGYKLADVEGKMTWRKLVHPNDLPKMLYYHQMRRKEPSKNIPNQYEIKMVHAKGHDIDVFLTIGMIPNTQESIASAMDITDRKNMERRLQESEERYRLILENIEDIFYEVDLKGNFTYINSAVKWVLGGYTPDELIGQSFRYIVDKENAKKAYAAYNKVYSTGAPERGFVWSVMQPNKNTKELEVSISPIRDTSGRITGFRGTARDITERKKAEKQLRYLSLHDSLTGLHNRAYLEEKMQVFRHKDYYPISIICADVDDLKLVNDNMGHPKGDELLVNAGKILKKAVRSNDVVARVGGDEFAILLPLTNSQAAEVVYQRIQNNIQRHNQKDTELPISISLGVATSKEKENILHTYKRADDKMYAAKRQRRAKQKCY